ncbi:methyl-accepting chemotaxis protein [Sesbania bispinosa]|nr:methyl-accepting chemotaxis protein [Sesbania bispinosa]
MHKEVELTMTAHGMHPTAHRLTQCRRQQSTQYNRRCNAADGAAQQQEQLASFTKKERHLPLLQIQLNRHMHQKGKEPLKASAKTEGVFLY